MKACNASQWSWKMERVLRCRKRTSKIQTRCPPPLKRWTSFTRLVSEELRKNSRSWRCWSDIMWHHKIVVNSWFSGWPDLKRQDCSIYHKYTTLTCEMQNEECLQNMYLPIRLSKTRRPKSRNAQDHHGRWCHKSSVSGDPKSEYGFAAKRELADWQAAEMC